MILLMYLLYQMFPRIHIFMHIVKHRIYINIVFFIIHLLFLHLITLRLQYLLFLFMHCSIVTTFHWVHLVLDLLFLINSNLNLFSLNLHIFVNLHIILFPIHLYIEISLPIFLLLNLYITINLL